MLVQSRTSPFKEEPPMRRGNRFVGIGLVILIALSSLPACAAGRKFDNTNAGVLPPISHPYGKTYGDWGAAWWTWVLSIPTPNNPLNDQTGANANQNQSGPVFFLAGTFCPDLNVGCSFATATRSVTVPSGKALFFPILNSECSTFEGNGTTEADLRACATSSIDAVTTMEADVDGVPIDGLTQYRGTSGLFTWGPLPANNLLEFFGFNAPAGTTSPAVQDGYYLMLAPLSMGAHTIHFTGSIGSAFGLDVTYHLTVGGSGSASELSTVLAPLTPVSGAPTWGRLKATYR
jgi:hypothetical protein